MMWIKRWSNVIAALTITRIEKGRTFRQQRPVQHLLIKSQAESRSVWQGDLPADRHDAMLEQVLHRGDAPVIQFGRILMQPCPAGDRRVNVEAGETGDAHVGKMRHDGFVVRRRQ